MEGVPHPTCMFASAKMKAWEEVAHFLLIPALLQSLSGLLPGACHTPERAPAEREESESEIPRETH